MLSHLKKYEILLASNSPRRRELLAGLDIDYRVTALPEVDESYPDTLSGEEIPLYISQEKAAAYRRFMKDNTLLITADTIVWLDGKVYGKPRDIADAKAMLQALSGKTTPSSPVSRSPLCKNRSPSPSPPKSLSPPSVTMKSITTWRRTAPSTKPEHTAYRNG